MNYNPWPLGKIPPHLRRPEIQQLREVGYKFNDAREAIGIFEEKVAKFTGAKYAVAVDCCSHGLRLCLEIKGRLDITIPNRTYISVPFQIIESGCYVYFEDLEWSGIYRLKPTNIYDAAVRWKRDMYIEGSMMVLSFQIKKTIPIGRGGMILLDDKEAYDKLKLMSYDGRDLNTPYDSPDHVKMYGFHYYMTPEDAARGILLMDEIETEGDSMSYVDYPRIDKIIDKL